MANHYIKLNGWKGDWKGTNLENFSFTSSHLDSVSQVEDSVLNKIYENVIDKNLTVTYDEITPFNSVDFVTRNYDFSSNILDIMIDRTADYYMRNIYSLNLKNLSVADYRVDSIADALRQLDYRVAQLRDLSGNLIKQKGSVELNKAIRDQGLLNIQYSSAVNNLELAKVTLLTSAPILQVIDEPQFSTEVSFVPVITAMIVGGIVGMFLAAGWLILAKVIKDSARRENELKASAATNSA
jgi:hypothetical protein